MDNKLTLWEAFQTRPPMFWLPADVVELTGEAIPKQVAEEIIKKASRSEKVFKAMCEAIAEETEEYVLDLQALQKEAKDNSY